MAKGLAFLASLRLALSNHPNCFFNFLLMSLSAGGQEIYASYVFLCPKDHDMAKWYGWLFLCAPVFILVIFGICLNNDFWRVFHGCKKRSSSAQIEFAARCRSFWSTLSRSLIIPSTWLFVSLLDGE
ncbi:hypothetical protein TNCT_447981 [Trichonephila clavata]|uniref:Uncharacterized protein n=1 Tax=Trichonephila clavata TaxID=2740835 RepID=A0A8X6HAQ5_TRICU|nr:hypothetical protein TNCT_447981 [Trichonephila clavata]